MLVLLLLLLLLPLLFFPRRSLTVNPSVAGERTFLLPRWALLALWCPFLALPTLPPLSLALLGLVTLQTLRVPHFRGALRGAVWTAGIATYHVVRNLSPDDCATVSSLWWVPFLPVMVYAISQVAWPRWDWPWSIAAPSTMGGSHYTAELLAAVACAAPWPVAGAAVVTMLFLRSRLPLVTVAVVYLIFHGSLAGLAAGLLLLVVIAFRFRSRSRPTLAIRFDIWSRTLDAIARRPWVGTGTGTFQDAVSDPSVKGERLRTAHAEFFERAVEWGIPGAAFFLVWVSKMSVRGPGAMALGLGAVGGHAFYHPVGWFLFCVLGGLGK